MPKAAEQGHHRKRRRKVEIVLPQRIEASVVTLAPHAIRRTAERGEMHVAHPQPSSGCIFSASSPTSADTLPSAVVAKYSVTGDATATDSATFKGGPTPSSFRVAPIFYGTTWLTASPTYLDVNGAIRTLLRSPYLSELDQYGFARLELIPPVVVNDTVTAFHDTDEAAGIVSSLISAGAVEVAGARSDAIIYVLFYPNGTAVSGADVCGWHYTHSGAWIAVVEFPDDGGTTAVTVDNITRIFSHELVETITDPDADAPKDGWVMNRTINKGREIGDACNNTDDFTAGVFVNAYWSERHKACVIPQPRRIATVTETLEVLSETEVSNGTVTFDKDPFDIRTCLNGTYAYTNSFVAQRARFAAASTGFTTPTYSWQLLGTKGGPQPLPDGFNGTVLLSVDTWADGPGGSTHTVADVPVEVAVTGSELTVVAGDIGVDYVNFPVLVEVTATEGVYSATALGLQLFVCQKFAWDENYTTDLENCRARLRKLVLDAVQLIPPIDTGDPATTWIDGVTGWIGGERAEEAAQAASVAAAIEKGHPDVAVRLRGLAAVACQIPATLLSETAQIEAT